MSELLDFKNKLELNSSNLFLKSETQALTFKEFRSFAKKIATELKNLNLTKGDLILLDIKDPFYLAGYVFACFHLKLKPALLNSFFKLEQIDAVLKDNSYGLFITDEKTNELNTLKIDSKKPFSFEEGDLNIDLDSEILFFTSGSIQSKTCVLTLKNFFYSAKGSLQNIPFDSQDSWGLCLPLFHVGGFSILIRSILSLGSVGTLSNDNFDLQFKKLNITHVSFVSTQFIRYLEETLSHLPQHILLGGSSIPETALKKALQQKLPIYKSYGMTEMASQICTTSKIVSEDQLLTSGKTLPFRELKIENKKIFVRGFCLFQGYLKNNILHSPLDKDGWFDTHDCGEIKNDSIQILGRVDRIFQSAGENISPEIIEQELLRIPGVLRAYVCPEPDETYGLKPVAYIEKKASLENDTILKTLGKKLSGLYRPKSLRPWQDAPKTSWKS